MIALTSGWGTGASGTAERPAQRGDGRCRSARNHLRESEDSPPGQEVRSFSICEANVAARAPETDSTFTQPWK